ncbi:MAG: DUF7689 domain-containing protein [Rhizomicrobium sp.]
MKFKFNLENYVSLQDLMRDFSYLFEVGFVITSYPDKNYNCIAWAADITDKWFDSSKEGKWPNDFKGPEFTDLIDAYEDLGFKKCNDGSYVEGLQKIAIYAKQGLNTFGFKTVFWTHAAKQLDADTWSSKIGKSFDIQHKTAHDLEVGKGNNSDVYGKVYVFMSRELKN